MQTLASRRSNSVSPQSRRIAVFAVLLFALAGLISGFAVGAFVRPKIGGIGSTGNNNIGSIVQQTKTATPVSTIKPREMSYPHVDHYSFREFANGETEYILSAHARDASGNPLHVAGITCKLWLTRNQILPQHNEWSPVGALYNPVTGEVPDSLIFDSSTPQTHLCDGNGAATWKYRVAQTVDPGTYYLAVVTDWAGVHYNIWWQLIQIKQQS
jgi:hypothetical protein